jgi:hypothetical protein
MKKGSDEENDEIVLRRVDLKEKARKEIEGRDLLVGPHPVLDLFPSKRRRERKKTVA